MGRFSTGLMVGLLAASAFALPAEAAITKLSARSALVLDEAGRVVFERHADAKLPPASTTKVLTVLVALENANLDDIVTISRKAAAAEPSSTAGHAWQPNLQPESPQPYSSKRYEKSAQCFESLSSAASTGIFLRSAIAEYFRS